MKKPAGSVRFWFYKQKTEKTKPNRNRQKTGKKPSQNRKKPSQNRKNRAKPVWTGFCPKITEPKPVGLTRFRFFFQKNKFGLVTFFDKNRTEPKMITPTKHLNTIGFSGLDRFRFGLGPFFLKRFGYFLKIKTEPNRKWSPLGIMLACQK